MTPPSALKNRSHVFDMRGDGQVMVWYGTVLYGMGCYGRVVYCMVWYGIVVYGMGWYGRVVYGMGWSSDGQTMVW